ncbi:Alcohol dehydrogenase GroES domain protein [Pedosphaera parvula Ellin514]|uniref:Alcohol dehydrogenase GroES domain protein n=2 Tax=Pedosphaera TaxID=1032526 RepID=B9XS80_PEDPL|nr:Alcohol dehydrogenase GroES domain protein [Pedosphaera parvula Ellin514]
MRAAVVESPLKIRIDKVPLPVPDVGAVRVRLEGCGVCGSNLSAWEGRPWFNYPLAPGELGHEGWGIVDALGSNTTKFKLGDRVAMLSYRAYAEYDVASEESMVKLPENLRNHLFPGEPLACAINVFRRCRIEPGQNVAIVGIGFMGALLTALAAQSGVNVIAISRRKTALQVAQACGAAEAIPMEDHFRIIDQVNTFTKSQGCDCVIEAVGCQGPLDLAGELTRERGRLVIAGYHQDGPRQINLQLWNWRGLDVINAHERDPAIYLRGMEAAVEAVASGTLNPAPLFTHTYKLEELPEALNAMKNRPDKFMKALITL